MTGLPRVLLGALLLAALAGCAGGAGGGSGTTADASRPASGPERAAIEQAFFGYYRALADRQFAVACGLRAPESIEVLLGKVRTTDPAVNNCEQALTLLYAAPNAGDLATGIVKTAKVSDVQLRGEEAVISWSGVVAKVPRTSADHLRNVAGSWKVAVTAD